MANRRDKHWAKFGPSFATTASADGDSESIVTSHLKNLAIQVGGTFVADVTIKVRLDPSLELIEIATVSAASLVPIPNDAAVSDVMITISGYVSGGVKALLVGRTAQE